MKKGSILRILVVAFILALLITTIPVVPALAAPEIDLSSDNGKVGDEIRLAGDGFKTSTTVYIYFSSDAAAVGDYIDDEVDAYERVKIMYTDGAGELYNYFDIPSWLNDGAVDEDVYGGKHYVYATYAHDKYIVAIADFYVIVGGITLDPDKGTAGTEIKITGTDFNIIEKITVRYDGGSMAIEKGDDETDIDGGFVSYILVPTSSAGDHIIKVIDESGSEAEATFTVEPEISFTPTSGSTGTKIIVRGSGFIGNGNLRLFIGTKEVVANGKTGSDGDFEIVFTVPELGPGIYIVEAQDDNGNSDGERFTITSGASISPVTSETLPGYVGTELTISGTSFIIGGLVTVTYDAIQVATTTADSNGAFLATFTVHESKGGEHIIIVTDGINTEEFTFIMESTMPSIPTLVEPVTGTEAKPETHFDWHDVNDPSGVTYNLQIATDKDFVTIALGKTGLTDSEYTLTEEEKLKSVSEENPYYWRVKAVDGASNESGWSDAGSFYIGFSFSLSHWVTYTLFGVGALILIGVGFWIGRKITYRISRKR